MKYLLYLTLQVLLLLSFKCFAAVDTTDTVTSLIAETSKDEWQDMSDPLAVYTQLGAGVTNKGLNLKVGQTYDTHNPETAAMNIIELKGIMGEALGWTGNNQRDNSIDSFRFRNFGVKLKNGHAHQLDINYNVDGNPFAAKQTADVSYSFIQALPAWGPVQLYPLAGAGVSIGEDAIETSSEGCSASSANCIDGGFSTMGVFGVVGMYSKLQITKKIWLNYNPMWLTTIAGDVNYEDNYYGGHGTIFTHEFAISYQFTPRFNIRYYANWSNHTSFLDGDQRVEVNYQL